MSCGSEGPHGGDGTFYQGADGSGACSFAPIPGDLMVGAMNQTDYAGSAPCGACAEITGPSGKVTIRITDLCPECKPGDIDLSPEAFALIADLNLGRVHIDWHYVECAVNGPIVYHFKDGSNQYWTAIQIRNAKHAIAKIEGKDQNGAYQPLSRMDYNYFIASSGLGPGPYSLRVTDVYGGVVEDTGIPFAADTDAPGAAQLPSCP
jgi:expansin (peptidoglycan-binding protein)